MQGGISNGETILLRVAFKPTATIRVAQQTVDREGERRDPRGRRAATIPACFRAPCPMVEAMVCLVLADHWLRQRAVDIWGRSGV